MIWCHSEDRKQFLIHYIAENFSKTCFLRSCGGILYNASYLEDGDGTDGDQDDNSDIYFGGQPSSVVGIVVLIVLLWMVQHVVVVPSSVLILHIQRQYDINSASTPRFPSLLPVGGALSNLGST